MKVFVQFQNGTDITIDDVYSTTTKGGYFIGQDIDGDKVFVSAEHNILYTEFDYEID